MSAILHRKLYEAYYAARKNKRLKNEQLQFEIRHEKEIYHLYQDIMNRCYEPLPTRVFVTHKPVIREIFAPRFRDRLVHHLIYGYLYEYLDRYFIYDSYSCRVGRGTLFGIERAKKFLRKVSVNYTQEAYVLKLDVQGYFMNINREILHQQLCRLIDYSKLDVTETEKRALQYLVEKVVLYDASKEAIRCSPGHFWDKIPASKSLFCTATLCGLPIGSLTSQLFSNVYLNDLDHFIKSKIKYYGRYVDDLLLMDKDKHLLMDMIPQIEKELEKVQLKLHPNKIVLQPFDKGFYFLGQYIKPNRCYVSNRVKKSLHKVHIRYQRFFDKMLSTRSTPSIEELAQIESELNAYFGVMSKANSYRLVHTFVEKLPLQIKEYMDFCFDKRQNKMKAIVKEEYRIKNNYCGPHTFTNL